MQQIIKNPQFIIANKEGFYLHIGIIGSLLLCIAFFTFFQKIDTGEKEPIIPENFMVSIDIMPETQQSSAPPPPSAPGVPVESDDIMLEEIPKEFTLDVMSFGVINAPPAPNFGTGLEMGTGLGSGSIVAVGPRPWHETIPEYSESEIKKGNSGMIEVKLRIDEKGNVTDIEITKNTTKSKKLEDSARKAALSSKYFPARDRSNNPIAVWTFKTYTFSAEIKKG